MTSWGGSITSGTVVVYSSVTRGISPSSGTSLEDRGLNARQESGLFPIGIGEPLVIF